MNLLLLRFDHCDDAFRNNVQDVNVVKEFHLGTNEMNTHTNMISKSEQIWFVFGQKCVNVTGVAHQFKGWPKSPNRRCP